MVISVGLSRRRGLALAGAAALSLVANGSAGAKSRASEAGPVDVTEVANLDRPWSLAFLPDANMLVTERLGRLRLVRPDGTVSAPLRGTPQVTSDGQGGLLDVVLDPAFATNQLVYVSFSEPGRGGASTAVARGRFAGDRLDSLEVIFSQTPKVDGGNHFGSRLAFAPDGRLFVTSGERFKFDPAQELGSGLGKIFRIDADGGIPADNPFVGRQGAQRAIWSYGHRNVQGASIHPGTGELWTHEFGPRGGDEVNIPKAGGNHGWPLVSWGRHYDGRLIPAPPTRPDTAQPIYSWVPSISPSGMAFYDGELFPAWRGSLLLGALSGEALIRLSLDGRAVAGEERLAMGARIRDVRQAPDGAVWLLTDGEDGRLLRLTPAT